MFSVNDRVRPGTTLPLALIADRDGDSRLMYAEFLRLSAFRVEETDDGRDALVKAIDLHPSVVVAETRLPGINGYELCRLLRTDAATRTTPIVMVTADAYPADIQRAETAGADTVLVKDLRDRSREARARIPAQIARSEAAVARSRSRRMLKSSHERGDTTAPPLPPPALVCPACDRPLLYLRSHIGGVSAHHSEQWDYFECPSACGTFQYRQRTRKLRRV
jgi:CheY-like chemotaxis protein